MAILEREWNPLQEGLDPGFRYRFAVRSAVTMEGWVKA
jgi:hypothetical protein